MVAFSGVCGRLGGDKIAECGRSSARWDWARLVVLGRQGFLFQNLRKYIYTEEWLGCLGCSLKMQKKEICKEWLGCLHLSFFFAWAAEKVKRFLIQAEKGRGSWYLKFEEADGKMFIFHLTLSFWRWISFTSNFSLSNIAALHSVSPTH